MTLTIKDIGEIGLLNRLKRFMRPGQIDDDIAEIQSTKKNLLINTDLLVEKIHFSDEISNAKDIGWKCIAVNASDLICSGSETINSYTIGLVVPPNTNWTWVKNLYQGMTEAIQEFGGEIIGGDCSSGTIKVISITAIGEKNHPRLHRGNALPGDYLVSTGSHGLSRLGLALLTSEELPSKASLSQQLTERAKQAHKRPYPAIEALETLRRSKPKKTSWRAAGTDSSDGLLEAIKAICDSSGCQAVLSGNALPKDPDWPNDTNWDEWCLNGGEDYEMVLSLPKEWAEAFTSKLKTARIIGQMQQGKPVVVWENLEKITNQKTKVFKHF